jgi:hypothetical protein
MNVLLVSIIVQPSHNAQITELVTAVNALLVMSKESQKIQGTCVLLCYVISATDTEIVFQTTRARSRANVQKIGAGNFVRLLQVIFLTLCSLYLRLFSCS